MGTLRAPSTAAALLLSAALTLSAPGAAAAADHSGAAYAALGDSYSSGLGAGDYLDGSGACRRSANAYPEQWAARHEPASFAFAACAGATVRDVLDRQLGALGPSTRLVSVTVGGNDTGFAGVMAACVLSSEERCLERIGSARSYGGTTLPGLLDRLYAAIRAAAPDARVVVLGYPRLYRLGADCPIGLTPARRRALDGAADDLDAVIAARAAAHGFHFGDVRPAFAPHTICSDGTWWLHGLTLPVQESYHPTAEGQEGGYLPVLEARADG